MAFGPYFLLATLEGLVTAAVLSLIALGLSLVFGVMRVVNVAHGEFYMLGAVLAWWVASLFGGHPAIGVMVALVLSPLVVAAIAFVAERLVLSRLKYEPEATIVATIGLLYIIQQLALTFYGPEARPVEAPFHYRMQLPWFGYSAYIIAPKIYKHKMFCYLLRVINHILFHSYVIFFVYTSSPSSCNWPNSYISIFKSS